MTYAFVIAVCVACFLFGSLVGAFAFGTIVVFGFMEQERRKKE